MAQAEVHVVSKNGDELPEAVWMSAFWRLKGHKDIARIHRTDNSLTLYLREGVAKTPEVLQGLRQLVPVNIGWMLKLS